MDRQTREHPVSILTSDWPDPLDTVLSLARHTGVWRVMGCEPGSVFTLHTGYISSVVVIMGALLTKQTPETDCFKYLQCYTYNR